MPLSDEFLSMLRCPISRRPLVAASAEEISLLNRRIREKGLQNRAGEAVEEPLEEGLVEPVERWFYPVRDNIPSLLKDEAISLPTADESPSPGVPSKD